MKRVVIQMGDGSIINIPADRVFQDGTFVYAYKDEELAAMVGIGKFDALWITDMKREVKP